MGPFLNRLMGLVANLFTASMVLGAPPSGWTTCGDLPDAYNNTACPATQSCAPQQWNPSNGSWGCCPFPNGVSCNKYTCCPEGHTCKNEGTWGIRGGFGVVSVCIPPEGSTDNATIGDQVCKTGPPVPLSTDLKNVLIVGDSVSIGYTPWVANAMADTVLVQHSPWGQDGGAEETQYGYRCIQNLIRAPDGTPLSPDVLMFNWGLHNSLSGNCTPPVPSEAPATTAQPPNGTCRYIVNCSMGLGSRAKAPANSTEDCCRACQASPNCGAGVYDYNGGCWLKSPQDVFAGCSPTTRNIVACINTAVKPEPPACDPGQSGSPDEYASYLQQIVDVLQTAPSLAKTKLLFAITSPDMCDVPINDIQVRLNTQAKAIMQKAGIPTVDLYSAITQECGPVPQAQCFGAAQCFCPHCYGNGQLGYQWLANTTIIPAIKKLL